jgi:hypothetical protein
MVFERILSSSVISPFVTISSTLTNEGKVKFFSHILSNILEVTVVESLLLAVSHIIE